MVTWRLNLQILGYLTITSVSSKLVSPPDHHFSNAFLAQKHMVLSLSISINLLIRSRLRHPHLEKSTRYYIFDWRQ
jgi:hypothetical protein